MKTSYLAATAVAALAWTVADNTAYAQATSAIDDRNSTTSAYSNQEIIVTARRKQESLQDVPEFVNGVGMEAVEKLKLTQLPSFNLWCRG